MSKQEALQALKGHGVDVTMWHGEELLHALQQANPFTVTTGKDDTGYYATTRRSTAEWTDAEGTVHPAVDRSEHYTYGEDAAHAAALLLLAQVSKYQLNQYALSWKQSAKNKVSL